MANEPAPNPPAPLTPDEELAWRALARAVLVIPRLLDGALLQAQGLGLTEYSVLMNLSEQPGRSMRMSELANAALISVSGLTRVVERLTRQGLVERVRADTDGRGQLAVLTPAGLARLEKAYPTLLASVREHIMDHLAGLDLAAFTHAMAGIAAPEMGPPLRRPPSPASPANRRQRETTTGPQGAR
jgi:DNA-binding MarR family transcriptional regulator